MYLKYDPKTSSCCINCYISLIISKEQIVLLQGLIAVAPTAPLSSFVVILIIKVINLPYDLKNNE